MSYILCLGFKSIIYKELPTVRLSINQHFIDEFSVDSNNKNTDIKNIWIYNDDFNNFKKSCYLENIYSWYEKNIKFDDIYPDEAIERHKELIWENESLYKLKEDPCTGRLVTESLVHLFLIDAYIGGADNVEL